MCNASNHPPGCNCGWGGVWYGSGGGDGFAHWLFNKPKAERKTGFQVATMSDLSGSVTSPNTTCPVCGAAVYYYESAYGGKVYFDELGPPWPKHPCTTREAISSPRSSAGKWSSEGWMPLKDVTITERPDVTGLYSATGVSLGKRISINFRSNQVVMADVFRYRLNEPGVFELSILDYNAIKMNWLVWSGMAAVDPTRYTGNLVCSVIHSHPQSVNKERPNSSVLKKPEMPKCPACSSHVKQERMAAHLERVHKVILISVCGEVTGRMFL